MNIPQEEVRIYMDFQINTRSGLNGFGRVFREQDGFASTTA